MFDFRTDAAFGVGRRAREIVAGPGCFFLDGGGGQVDAAVVDHCVCVSTIAVAVRSMRGRESVLPLILYSPLSWLRLLRTLSADEGVDPTVSTRSKPGWAGSVVEVAEPGRTFSSLGMLRPGRRAKGLRIGIVAVLSPRCAV